MAAYIEKNPGIGGSVSGNGSGIGQVGSNLAGGGGAGGAGYKPPGPHAANAYQRDRWTQKYGTASPKDFDLPKVRVAGVDLNRGDFLYRGNSQNEWNERANALAGRGPMQGQFGAADAMRAQQVGQLQQAQQTRQMYLDAAMGNAPSLAQAQLQQGVDRGIAGQLAVANSARGGMAQRAAAMRSAQLQGQDQMAGLGAQSAMLRAQETAAARQGLLGADAQLMAGMSGIRGADQGQAGMNLNAALQGRAQNDAAMQAMYGYGMNASGAEMSGRQGYANAQAGYDFNTQTANANLEAGKATSEQQLGSQAAGAGGAAAAGLLGLLAFSDERAKTKIAPAEKDVDGFLKTLRPYSYEYKDKAHGEGKKTSVMAQDLEKTSLGETLVSRDKPTGLRQVNYAKALPLMLASLGRLSDRLEKAEARR